MARYKLKQTSKGIKVLWIIDTYSGFIVKEMSPFDKGNINIMRSELAKLNK